MMSMPADEYATDLTDAQWRLSSRYYPPRRGILAGRAARGGIHARSSMVFCI